MNPYVIFTIILLEIISIGILLYILIDVKDIRRRSHPVENPSHLRYIRDRSEFNKIGVEITNGTTSGDTLYLVLRSGTIESEFSAALRKFRSHQDTNLIVIVSNQHTFLSNCSVEFTPLISKVYENPDCEGVRAMLLEPEDPVRDAARMGGYFYISDGHHHQSDDGFYAVSPYSNTFLRTYMKMLVKSGEQIK
jgi:hypothetical protein